MLVKNQTLSALSSQKWGWRGSVASGPGVFSEVQIRDSIVGWQFSKDLSSKGDE